MVINKASNQYGTVQRPQTDPITKKSVENQPVVEQKSPLRDQLEAIGLGLLGIGGLIGTSLGIGGVLKAVSEREPPSTEQKVKIEILSKQIVEAEDCIDLEDAIASIEYDMGISDRELTAEEHQILKDLSSAFSLTEEQLSINASERDGGLFLAIHDISEKQSEEILGFLEQVTSQPESTKYLRFKSNFNGASRWYDLRSK